jgi:hypothetical protein
MVLLQWYYGWNTANRKVIALSLREYPQTHVTFDPTEPFGIVFQRKCQIEQ